MVLRNQILRKQGLRKQFCSNKICAKLFCANEICANEVSPVNVRPLLNSFDIKAKAAALKAEKERAKADAQKEDAGNSSMDVESSNIGASQPAVENPTVEDDLESPSDPLGDYRTENISDILDTPLESEAPTSPKSYTLSEIDRYLASPSHGTSDISVAAQMDSVALAPIPEQTEPDPNLQDMDSDVH